MKRLVTIPLAAVAVLYAQAVLSITPVEVAKLLATDGAENDQFGLSVAVAGDTALIGAPTDDDDNGVSNTGAAYVFTRDGTGNWSQQAKLTAVDAALGDQFGGSVAMEGDTAVIGANGNIRTAYVFTRDGTGSWSQQAKLTEPASVVSVAVAGDTIVIGSPTFEGGGAAYIFTRDATGSWSQQAKLAATDGFSSSFGFSIDLEGKTAVIGDPSNSENGTQSGAAYVFTRDGAGNWSQQAKLTAADAAKDDRFGGSVARSGDTIVIGAFDDDDDNNGTPETGSAYVFTRDGTGNWSQQAKLTASDASFLSGFGRQVAVEGDVAIIGTEDFRLQDVYVFTRDAMGDWSEQAKLTASDASQFNQFGRSIAMEGDTLVIGASNQRRAGTSSTRTGAVYVFSLGLETPICDIQLNQASFVIGETVTADVFRFANLAAADMAVELKIWLGLSGAAPVSVANLGVDGSFVLPAGIDFDLGPLPLLPVTAALPTSDYEFSCRMLDPVTGELLAEDRNLFDIR